tara:strand:- start:66 stop:281 length:216 start_codon:yes stop_codon:yes gene_type:complete
MARTGRNLTFFAGKEVGLFEHHGAYQASCSGVKLVLSEDSVKTHGYPVDFAPESCHCELCKVLVPFGPSYH